MLSAPAAGAAASLSRHLNAVLLDLEPESLGLYWPHRSEFNAAAGVLGDSRFAKMPKSLPYARRKPVSMEYRAWGGGAPTAVDECGIPASEGAPALPDVVLVPCVGFTSDGFRLGYGGGYFDRWLAQHPDVTAIGVAWSGGEIDPAMLQVQAHDLPLALIVTDLGVVS
jgi:5-formyltetrahydrofolate cyclo-ligase